MNLFAKGRAWLGDQLKAAAGVEIVYVRGATVIPITAVPGNTLFARNQTESGAAVVWGDRDYLIEVADLLPLTSPAVGDRVVEAIDGADVTFEVSAPDTGEPAWRYSDSARSRFRVHTKRVD